MMSERMDGTPAEVFDELRREIRREGARAAYAALLQVCNDPKAPAPARATAGVAILRASGLFEKNEGADDGRLLSEMTPGELSTLVRRHEQNLRKANADLKKAERDAEGLDVLD